HFLDFVRSHAAMLPSFHLMMESEVTDVVRDGERVTGVRLGDGRTIAARLVVACDGRHSTLRAKVWPAPSSVTTLGAPIDVVWLRVPRHAETDDSVFGIVTASAFLVTLDRGDYWQCAFLVAKGGVDAMKAKGIDAFRASVRAVAPWLGDRLDTIRS